MVIYVLFSFIRIHRCELLGVVGSQCFILKVLVCAVKFQDSLVRGFLEFKCLSVPQLHFPKPEFVDCPSALFLLTVSIVFDICCCC